ncbi:phosphotransferase, partial [Oryctes borbonicus]
TFTEYLKLDQPEKQERMSINNLGELIHPYLESHGKRFVSYEASYFLPPGENYGSVLLSLKIKVKNRNNQEEDIYCVAKMLPPNEILREYFNTSVTFETEVIHYNTVMPTLKNFGKEMGVDTLANFCVTCLGARISLDPKSNIADDDAVFVLENLKMQGYTVGDRFTGFDIETTKSVLESLARMHAACLGIKFKKPDVFKAKILPNLEKGMGFIANDNLLDNLVNTVKKYAAKSPACIPLLDRIGAGVRRMKDTFVYSKSKEPFASLVHTDLWVNNVLIKFQDGKPSHNILIDFPLCIYGNPARDVIFFIYSSANLDVLKTNVDSLIKFYYNNLIGTLKQLKCDTTQMTYDLFMEEVATAAKNTEFAHCIFMLTPIYTNKGEIKDMRDWKLEDIIPTKEECLHPNYHEKLYVTCLDFAKRNWI